MSAPRVFADTNNNANNYNNTTSTHAAANHNNNQINSNSSPSSSADARNSLTWPSSPLLDLNMASGSGSGTWPTAASGERQVKPVKLAKITVASSAVSRRADEEKMFHFSSQQSAQSGHAAAIRYPSASESTSIYPVAQYSSTRNSADDATAAAGEQLHTVAAATTLIKCNIVSQLFSASANSRRRWLMLCALALSLLMLAAESVSGASISQKSPPSSAASQQWPAAPQPQISESKSKISKADEALEAQRHRRQQQQQQSASPPASHKLVQAEDQQSEGSNLSADERRHYTQPTYGDNVAPPKASSDGNYNSAHVHSYVDELPSDDQEPEDTIILLLSENQPSLSSIRRLIKRSGISDQRLAEIQMLRALKKQMERNNKITTSSTSEPAAGLASK